MLSQKFINDAGSGHLVAPLICYELREADVFVAITPLSQQVFAMMVTYCGLLFSSEQQFKRYVINLKQDGTEIFITHLRNPNQASLQNELTFLPDANDIIVSPPTLKHLGLADHPLFEYSLAKSRDYMFMQHPLDFTL